MKNKTILEITRDTDMTSSLSLSSAIENKSLTHARRERERETKRTTHVGESNHRVAPITTSGHKCELIPAPAAAEALPNHVT